MKQKKDNQNNSTTSQKRAQAQSKQSEKKNLPYLLQQLEIIREEIKERESENQTIMNAVNAIVDFTTFYYEKFRSLEQRVKVIEANRIDPILLQDFDKNVQ